MFLIPVIDLQRGQVVHARRGRRQDYRPIASLLADGSEPVVLARALCRYCASSRLYAADLDALAGAAPQLAAWRALLQALPEIELWLDAGFADADAATALRHALGPHSARMVPVFASESLRSRDELQRCTAVHADAVLSLDRRDGQRMDAAGCWDAPELWPQRVIAMTLERVGADAGPDLATLRALQARSPQTQLIGAGGIRDAANVAQARAAGAAGWLVASALHDQRLPAVQA